MQCQRPCFQRILWTISSCCKKTHYTTTCTYPYLTLEEKLQKVEKVTSTLKHMISEKDNYVAYSQKHSNQTRSLKAPIFSPLAVFKGETPATSTHICGVVWRGKHGASEQQPGASQLHSSRFSILSFATDMSHSSIFPPLPAAPQRIQFHKAMPQDPDWTCRTNALQRNGTKDGLLIRRKKSLWGMWWRAKISLVFFEKDQLQILPNKQAWHGSMRQDKTRHVINLH